MAGSKIGELNGKWSVIFRTWMVLEPLLIVTLLPWCVWVTTDTLDQRRIHAEMNGEFQKQMSIIVREVENKISTLPPQEWRMRIERIAISLDELKSNQIRILTKIEH